MADPSEASGSREPRQPFAPWMRHEPAVLSTIHRSAKRMGHYAWIETRLFELLGTWAATVPEVEIKERLGTRAHHHAWHARLWQERLPELREIDTASLVRPSDPRLAAMFDSVSEPVAPELSIEKLVGVYRVVVPRKIAAYSHHRNVASTVTDGPTIRTLDLVLRDEVDDWREGEMMIQSLLGSADDVRRACDHQARIEGMVVTAGGISGPELTDGGREI